MRAAPTVLFARTELRRRWLSLLGLAALVALAGAFVLTAATGARRVATVAGLPLGFVTGAIAWRLSMRNLGVLDTFAVPPVATSSIAVATLIIAVLGAFTIAINARRAPLVASLRTE